MNTQRQKTGGRQKGTPNKVTTSTRDFLNRLIEGNQDLIIENFRKLEPYQMMTILAKILPYITPKLATKTEKDEHDIALQQMNSYLQLAKIVNKWEEQEEEEEQMPSSQPFQKTSTLDSDTSSFSASGDSHSAQSEDEPLNLKTSILDNGNASGIPAEEPSGTPCPAQSEQSLTVLKPAGIQKPKRQRQLQPFYASIMQKRRKR